MAVLTLETSVARALSLHCLLHDDLLGVQVHPDQGAADGGGEADQMVQAPVIRFTNHLPPWVLCLPGIEEMVGAILQAALARYYCYISQGVGSRGTGKAKSDGEGDQEDCNQILSSGIHTLHQEAVIQAEEEVSKHAGVG